MRERLVEPVQLALRRLEERRVLDVSAAFLTSTGALSIDLTDSPDTATVSIDNGELVIHDRSNNRVDIDVDQGGPGTVNVSAVKRLDVRGDANLDQRLDIETFLNPTDGLSIDDQIEAASISQNIGRVANNGILIESRGLELGADLEATASEIILRSDTTLTDDVTLTATSILLAGSLNDDGQATTGSDLRLNASDLSRIEAVVGNTSSIERLQTDTPGRTELAEDIAADGNTVIFNDAVLLTNDVTISDGGVTGIKFNSTVDSAVDGHHRLTLTATSGRVAFSGNIGTGLAGDQSLGQLTVTTAADGVIIGEKAGVTEVRVDQGLNIGSVDQVGGVGIVLNGGPLGEMLIRSTGDPIRFNGPVEFQTNLTIESSDGDVIFTASAPIDSQPNTTRRLTVDAAAGSVFFNNTVGATSPLSGLTIVRADAGVTFGNADTATPGSDGPTTRIRSTGAVDIGTGTNVITGGITFNGGLGAEVLLTTTGDDVRINGPVRLNSGLEIDTGAGPGSIRFTSDASIDGEIGAANDLVLTAGTGSILFNANLGAVDPIGRLVVDRADGGITFGEADAVSGPGGTGSVTIVQAHAGIDLGTTSNAIAGGIRLNGGSDPLLMATDGTNLRLNGEIELASDVQLQTGTGAGDVVLTNDSPVDSELGEFNALTFDAGMGVVRINENLGEQRALRDLIVTRADGGVFLGEAGDEVPGAGSVGSVTLINLTGKVDLGVGSNVINGAGIVVHGSLVNRFRMTAGGDVRFNGATRFHTDATINSGPDTSDITFTSDSPIDSAAGVISDLTLNAGEGRVIFNEDIGAADALGALSILQADGGVAFGGASQEVPGDGGAGPVNIVRTERAIDVGVDHEIAGRGIELNGGGNPLSISTTADRIRWNGMLLLQSDVSMSTGASGAGDIVFTNVTTIDSSDGPELATTVERNSLTLEAGVGKIGFNANLGSTQRLNELIVESASGGVLFGQADLLTGTELGPVSQVLTAGQIDIGRGTTAGDVITGGIVLNGGANSLLMETEANELRLNGPLQLQTDTILSTGSGDGDLELTSAATVNSQSGEANDLTISLDSGNGTLEANLGANERLGRVRITAANDLTANGTIDASHLLQEGGTGTTTFNGAISTDSATVAGINLTGNNFALNAPITATGNGEVTITHTGLLDIANAANMEIDGRFLEEGGVVETAADIVTRGGTIEFRSTVTMTDGADANVQFDTTAGGTIAGADITFASTIDGENDSAERVTFVAGSGNVSLTGPVGSLVRLDTVGVSSATNVDLNNGLTVTHFAQTQGTGTTTFAGPINASSSAETAIDVSTVNVVFQNAVTTTGIGTVRVDIAGQLNVHDAADMNLNGSFTQIGQGAVALGADFTTTDDDVSFEGVVTLTDDLRFDTGAGAGSVTFAATVDGMVACQEDLTFATGTGAVLFLDDLGQVIAPGDLSIEDSGNVQFGGDTTVNTLRQLAGTGTTSINGAFNTKTSAAVDIRNANIFINGDLNTSGTGAAVMLTTTDDVSIQGSVTTGAGTLTINAADDLLMGPNGLLATEDAEINLLADADTIADEGQGGAILMSNGALITAGNGQITLQADEDIRIGQLVTSELVQLTSLNGAILDGGDSVRQPSLGDADVIADRIAFRAATGIGQDDMLDTQTNLIAANNRLGGGLRINNDTGGELTIGEADGLAGIQLGPTIGGINEVGDLEIINIGTIRVVSAINNNAGDDTIFRAEGTDPVPIFEIPMGIELLDTVDSLRQSGGILTDLQTLGLIDLPNGRPGLEQLMTIVDDPAGLQQLVGVLDDLQRLDVFDLPNERPSDQDLVTLIANATRRQQFSDILDDPARLPLMVELLDNREQVDILFELLNDRDVLDTLLEINEGIEELSGNLILNAPVQNRGGDGWVVMFSGGHIIVRDSLPENEVDDVPTFPQAEIAVQNRGAIRGEARGRVLVDSSPENYTILRTRAERFEIDPTVVISNGTIDITQPYHFIDTEGGAELDELSTITGGVFDDILVLRLEDVEHDVLLTDSFGEDLSDTFVRTGPGNLDLLSDHTLDEVGSLIVLRYVREDVNGTIEEFWREQSRDAVPDPRLNPTGFEESLRAIREITSPEVVNVPPLIRVFAVDQGGSQIDQRGRAQLRVVIGDPIDFVHLERNFHLAVDWGDGNLENYPIAGNPIANIFFRSSAGESLVREPDATVTPIFDTGLLEDDGVTFDRGVYFVHHTYTRIVNPLDPAAPVIVRAELRYDARREGEVAIDNTRPWVTSGEFNGIRFFENASTEVFGEAEAEFRSPGLGQGFFVKVVDSEIIPVARRSSTLQAVAGQAASVSVESQEDIELVTTQFETQQFGEYRLFLRVVDTIQEFEYDDEYNLELELLADPLELFRQYRFPDGHYRIYLEEIRTKRQRLILDVHIFEGRIVPPDFREGAGERQPGTEPVDEEATEENEDMEAVEGAPAAEGDNESESETPQASLPAATQPEIATVDPAREAEMHAALAGGGAWIASRALWRRELQMALQSGRRRFDLAARLSRKLKHEEANRKSSGVRS